MAAANLAPFRKLERGSQAVAELFVAKCILTYGAAACVNYTSENFLES